AASSRSGPMSLSLTGAVDPGSTSAGSIRNAGMSVVVGLANGIAALAMSHTPPAPTRNTTTTTESRMSTARPQRATPDHRLDGESESATGGTSRPPRGPRAGDGDQEHEAALYPASGGETTTCRNMSYGTSSRTSWPRRDAAVRAGPHTTPARCRAAGDPARSTVRACGTGRQA